MSGGPDSLALLLLASAALPVERIDVATVDHALREGSVEEAAAVAALCKRLGVTHSTLTATWGEPPTAAIQARAREMRYRLLAEWAEAPRLAAVATAHHADDQAETLLMRLARGAGLGGLAGVRAATEVGGLRIIRPLLNWRRAELAQIVAAARIESADDPSNRDPRHERTRARAFLSGRDWPDPLQFAASAAHLADADEALRHAQPLVMQGRIEPRGNGFAIDPSGLPREWRRRLLLTLFERAPRGPDLDRALESLESGRTCTLGGLKLIGGDRWRAEPAPPRR